MRWRFKRCLFGMRPAARAWEADYSAKLGALGMAKGVACPTAFYHSGKEMMCVVHGDDFTFLGWASDLEEMAERLRDHYQFKVRGILGGEPGDVQDITILNRKLTWKANEMKYEADPKHAEIIERGGGLDGRPRVWTGPV